MLHTNRASATARQAETRVKSDGTVERITAASCRSNNFPASQLQSTMLAKPRTPGPTNATQITHTASQCGAGGKEDWSIGGGRRTESRPPAALLLAAVPDVEASLDGSSSAGGAAASRRALLRLLLLEPPPPERAAAVTTEEEEASRWG